jgi:lipoprotein-releasing system permease protein
LPGWEFTLWTDAGEARLAAMRNEQTMMQFVLSIIALVAAFSVMNTTITVTTQKRREIGVLAALGCRRGQILGIFLNQAGVVGLLGTGLGLGGSLLVLWLRDDLRALLAAATGGQVHAVEGVFLATIPALVRPGDVVLTCLTSLGLCLLAGLIPAWFAARVDPAVALRD